MNRFHRFSSTCIFLGMLSTSVMGLSACSPAPQDSSVVQQQQASQLLAATFEEYSHALMALEPMRATFRGQHQYNDQLPNIFSAEHRERRRLLEEEYLAVLNRINPELLNADDRLSYRIFRYEREMELARMAHPEHLMPLNQFYNMTNTWAMLGSGTSAQPFRDVRDYENWAARMERIPVLIDEMITNMNEGIAQGVTQPRVLMERVQTQIAAHLVDDLQESLFMRPILSFPEGVSEADQVRLAERYETLLSETVLPAYQRLFDYLERDYIPASRTGSYGIGSLPGGQAWYQFLVQWHTTTPMTVTEVHEVGLAEVERIQNAIQAVMDEVEFEGSMEAFFVFTRDDPQFHYSSREEMLEDYRAFAAKVDAVSDRLFFPEMLPQADYEIRKVERFRERSASSGSYSRPSEDGSRPGIFYLNTYDLPSRPTWAKGALTLHEAVPGHHYQIALQQELTHLPDFRRFGSITAYIEGWGLYSESLGDELGVYDAYDRYGALIAELWRAIRLVVDTGIHAKGWSRQEVLDYMAANAPVGEARRVSEAERFMALPGQALAYKIGQLHIQSLRDRAEDALGEGFDVREFHRQVLKNGSLPLAILEEEIDAWIAREM